MRIDDAPLPKSGPGSPGRPIQRLGVLGDIHVEDQRLATAIAWLNGQGVDRIVHVGDVTDGTGSLSRTLALLAEHQIAGICGNHERWFLKGAMRTLRDAHPPELLTPEVARELSALPPLLALETVRGPLLVCHGVGEDDMLVLKPDTILGFLSGTPAFDAVFRTTRFRFVVAGHTHQHAVHPVGTLTWINAGTLKGDDSPGVTLIDFGRAEVKYGSLEDPARVGETETVRFPS